MVYPRALSDQAERGSFSPQIPICTDLVSRGFAGKYRRLVEPLIQYRPRAMAVADSLKNARIVPLDCMTFAEAGHAQTQKTDG